MQGIALGVDVVRKVKYGANEGQASGRGRRCCVEESGDEVGGGDGKGEGMAVGGRLRKGGMWCGEG